MESPGRTPVATSRGSSEGRSRPALTAVVALALAVAGVGLVVSAFRAGNRTRSAATADIPTSEQIAFATGVGGHWQLFTVAADGAGVTQLTDLTTNQFHPAWSPDGTRIAFDAQSGDGEMQIQVIDANGGNLRTLTEGPGWNYLPAWSPDGDQIAFVSNRDGNDEIYVMNLDGSGQERLTADPEEDLSPSWSPDGTMIAFQSNRDGYNRIYVMHADGSGVMELADVEGFDPDWSAAGSRIAFASTTDGNPEIYAINSDGSDLDRLTHDPSHDWNPVWSPDGSKITFESDRDREVGIYVMNSDGTDVHRLVDTGAQACCPAWQPHPDVEPSGTPTPTYLSVDERWAPPTYPEGDRLVMPVTFPDGTTAEVVYPSDLALEKLSVYPDTFADGGGRQCGWGVHATRYDPHVGWIRGAEPLTEHVGADGTTVELWEGTRDNEPYDYLVYRFGSWSVLVPCLGDGVIDQETLAVWAENLHGHESADGLLVLEGTPPLVLHPWRDQNGPALRFSNKDVIIDIRPLSDQCDPASGWGGDTDAADGVVQWCVQPEGGIYVYANAFAPEGEDSLRALVDGLEVRVVRPPG